MTNENTPDAAVGLAEMLASLRSELKRSQELATESNIKFEIQNIDLELKVSVQKDVELNGKAGVKFWVVDAGVGGNFTDSNSHVQTIKLSMKAKDDKKSDENGNPRDANVRG